MAQGYETFSNLRVPSPGVLIRKITVLLDLYRKSHVFWEATISGVSSSFEALRFRAYLQGQGDLLIGE